MHTPKPTSPRRIKLTITVLNERGMGIASHRGRKILVEKALPGEQVWIEYDRSRPRKDRVRLQEVLTPARQRVEPPCPYFGRCGGCHLQHLEYGAQLEWKGEAIRRLLEAHPGAGPITVHEVEGMPTPLHYRNKTQMPLRMVDGRVEFGLFRSGTHELIPLQACPVESRAANLALQIVRDWARRHAIPPYDESRHTGLLRHVLIRQGYFTRQLMVVLVTTGWEIPHCSELIAALQRHLPELRSVQVNRNARRTNFVPGPESRVLQGTRWIEEQIAEVRFRIYPHTFFQVNSVQWEKLLQKFQAITGLRPTDRVVDLYCGVGAISLPVARRVAQVTGIEIGEDAVAAARENALANGIGNARFLAGDAGKVFAEMHAAEAPPDVVIVDPPRKGLDEAIIADICAAHPREIVYISCNPRTLVRDLVHFRQRGYRTGEIYPFDLFPQTYHVECLTVLRHS